MTREQRTMTALMPFFVAYSEFDETGVDDKLKIILEAAKAALAEADKDTQALLTEAQEALEMLYNENVDYITRNNLGEPNHNRSMQIANLTLTKLKQKG